MAERPKVDKIYKHFKGEYYLVLDIATHTEDGEEYVVYRRFNDDEATVWARPLRHWMAPAKTESGEVQRFVEVDPVKEFVKKTSKNAE